MTTTAYRPRPIRRPRRSRAEIEAIEGHIVKALEADHPMTVRQLFYRLVGLGAIDKTEAAYKGTVVRLLSEMRRSGRVPFAWLSDSTRWMRKPRSHDSLEAALRDTARTYRRDLWGNQSTYVEIWLEKDALAGVLYEVTGEYDVPLMVTRGYPSLTYLHSAAEAIANVGKPAHLFYFGDWDPSGLDITRSVEQGLREFAPNANVTFSRVAVTAEQIGSMGLPTRPTKTTDSRSKGFEGGSVEVDAIPPKALKRIAEECIAAHIDPARLEALRRVERMERATLNAIALGGIEASR